MTLTARPTEQPLAPAPHRFTAQEYLEMDRLGFFLDKRVEFIDGEILDMPARELPHRRAVTRCFWLAAQLYSDPTHFFIVTQGTLRLGDDMPEPDLYVLPCSEDTPEEQLPLPLFVLEISEKTYRHDVGRKMRLYARHRVPEYLVLDIARRQLEVFSDLVQDASGAWTYRLRRSLTEGGVFTPSNGPAVELPVKQMLP